MTFRRKLMPIEQRVIVVGEGGLNCTVNLVNLVAYWLCTVQIKSDKLTQVFFASCMFGSSTREKIEQEKFTTFSLRRGPTHPPNILPHIYPKCCDVGEKFKDPKGCRRSAILVITSPVNKRDFNSVSIYFAFLDNWSVARLLLGAMHGIWSDGRAEVKNLAKF